MPGPKLAQTIVSPEASLRETVLGQSCEVLERSRIEYSSLGDYSYVGQDCMISDSEIGRFCAIAATVRIGAPNHPMQRASQHRFTYCPEYYAAGQSRDQAFFAARRAARVVIGNDVWIGHGVIVLPGLRIGDGAVLAAGAVVTKDVAPWSIIAGVPGRHVKYRFPAEVRASLARIAWWDWPMAQIMANLAGFRDDDASAFCAALDPAFAAPAFSGAQAFSDQG
ncbi:DapH/DapD/GlmU-related protein [Pseudogemmobacter hezensis]|uniref:DapH/DapD/GlmU-related protein n=1 Tax=Pseudogemmobacter hezensis TaxID=2737662 RepID=UPI0020A66AF4|nr:DapH/DapD/GlmU-related protein [Pseudogemmobacter hezensis]